MLNKLQTLREERNDEKGFTLIELLVVVVIIGILIAIAIPLYLNYQKGAKNKSVQSDTRNAIAVVEQCYTDTNNTYPTTGQTFTAPGAAVAGCNTTGSRINVSDGNTLTYTLAAGVYTINTVNADTGKSYTYNSGTGVTTHN